MRRQHKCVAILAIALATNAGAAKADRVVLAPTGETLNPLNFQTQFALNPERKFRNRIWMRFSTPQGIEIEAERLDEPIEPKKAYAFNIQYPFTTELVAGLPAITVGVRDITGTSVEQGSFYLSVTKSIQLSDRQANLTRSFKITAGAGTSKIGGLFVGGYLQLRSGLKLNAEYFRNQQNYSAAIPLNRYLDARAYSLDGRLYYGLSFSLTR